jgi:hypothetical protein
VLYTGRGGGRRHYIIHRAGDSRADGPTGSRDDGPGQRRDRAGREKGGGRVGEQMGTWRSCRWWCPENSTRSGSPVWMARGDVMENKIKSSHHASTTGSTYSPLQTPTSGEAKKRSNLTPSNLARQPSHFLPSRHLRMRPPAPHATRSPSLPDSHRPARPTAGPARILGGRGPSGRGEGPRAAALGLHPRTPPNLPPLDVVPP